MSKESETSNPSGNVDPSGGNNTSKVPNTLITTIQFDGTNYLAWSQSALLYISGKDKKTYILDEMVIPSVTNLKYRKWKTENTTIMSWLLHSMKLEISRHYLHLKTAKQI